MAGGGGQTVEVRKSAESATWYIASVVDVAKDLVRVSFEKDVWPVKEVPINLVRMAPPASDNENFSPKVDDKVEVHVPATESSPPGWSQGRVKTIKSKDFYFVTFESAHRAMQDTIVERESLRRPSSSPALDPSTLTRKLIPVERGLHGWISSDDSKGCLTNVAAKASLLAAACTSGTRASPKVLLIGDARAVHLAEKLLVDIHFKNQMKMQLFHEQREYYMRQLKWYEEWNGGSHKEVFTVDSSFAGKIIGKGGENVRRIRDEFGVEVKVVASQHDWNETVVTVTGESAEDVKKARDQMEYVHCRIEIEPDQVGWIVGKGYSNLHDIQTKAELQYVRFDDKTSSIELGGLRQQVEDAKLMVSVHRGYLDVYRDMSNEQRTLSQQFAELDRSKGGKGKGGGRSGRGRGRGRGGADEEEDDEDEAENRPPLRGGRGGGQEGGGKGGKGGKGGGGGGGKSGEGKSGDGKSSGGKSGGDGKGSGGGKSGGGKAGGGKARGK